MIQDEVRSLALPGIETRNASKLKMLYIARNYNEIVDFSCGSKQVVNI